MKKLLALSLVFVLALMISMSGALASPEDMLGQFLPDFVVNTIDGGSFILSDSLMTHDLVLINFWATWCGPCCMEFPFLETAWEDYSDRVDVIALSVEETDSFSTLRSFARDYGLNFRIGRDDVKMFDDMAGSAIPTTLIVDRNQRVVAVEIGAKSSAKEFTSLFDSLLAEVPAKPAAPARCTLCFRDAYGNPVPGVTVAFCNGEYDPIETDSNGQVFFDGDPNEYHVHLLGVPYGYSLPWEELRIAGSEFDLTITLYPN